VTVLAHERESRGRFTQNWCSREPLNSSTKACEDSIDRALAPPSRKRSAPSSSGHLATVVVHIVEVVLGKMSPPDCRETSRRDYCSTVRKGLQDRSVFARESYVTPRRAARFVVSPIPFSKHECLLETHHQSQADVDRSTCRMHPDNRSRPAVTVSGRRASDPARMV